MVLQLELFRYTTWNEDLFLFLHRFFFLNNKNVDRQIAAHYSPQKKSENTDDTNFVCCDSVEKWQAVYTILEAFGNSSTTMNTNASHFSHVVSLDFDQAGQVASASIQVAYTNIRTVRNVDALS